MCYLPTQRILNTRSLLFHVFLLLELAGNCDAQIRETTLGVIHTIPTPGPFSEVRQFPRSADSSIVLVLWNERSQEIDIVRPDSSFATSSVERHFLRIPFDDVLLADVNHDKKTDLLVLSKTERTISVIVDIGSDTLDAVSTLKLPSVPSGWKLGDINNDGIPDLLVYDRNNPGILPLFGKGTGKFVEGKVIAPELPVGGIALTHLNNDNLIDIVAYDWVKSELHLLYGVGRGRFLDQSTFQIRGEVAEIMPARLDPASPLSLVLVTAHPSELQDWQGDGIGDFRLAGQTALTDPPASWALGDVNGDQWTDFAYVGSTSSLQIVMNNGDEWSQDRVQFWAGKDPVAVLLQDFNHDGRIDALVLDRGGKSLRFYFNGSQDNTLTDSLDFAVGTQPAGVVIQRLGIGTGNDLAVVNSQDQSLSLFTNRGKGGLLGPTSYSLSINPQFLTTHSVTDSSARFILTSVAGDSLLLFSVNFKDSSSSYAVIPSEGFTQVVQTGLNALDQVEFFTFNTFTGEQSPAIHYYERLNPGTFIEQSFRLSRPDELLGAGAAFVNADRFPDLIYVYRNADSGTVDMAVSYGDSLMSFSLRHSTIGLHQSNSAPSLLWAGSFNAEDTNDVLIYSGGNSNILELSRGKGNGQFGEPLVLLHN
ncbi:MAG TPA: VCBS repeat-containing protein, partial [Bacteroidota bacterium]